ncbi:4-(cytidine 5'-diphospho)-2-C-methyl-D-erythritol kinase [Clostridium algidicarnis]|uniref:4-(cytidine 5'-diphospho)-2-C-methyl-D-erythritol kinase n=1 Tax=Clostridium algidicarnis TaxID=37659 RepID=UPI001C0B1584|nr:4-(cytidine 5'-diphospho)-2-C-methyl-D-erythritol kinase [Clostridium algidicarnis]MBU3209800.1 4-(cytidine 5'-diphospho)-2-C-methyl-D-erythritol kinase [Clostridium algidicarnis]MBU3228593.1 4-(cytidine 5'-diphospho)-2-C-methyl-D-erythritol kinase [Clostridium algidicarnis]MBU3251930.1 4-(cytidine 5'-diphospho)-2-C-methyl-D-erythritol kinase [Clostridium algidicarnis]
MEIKAHGKINIALDVIGKREDGYHTLKMIMQTIDIYDVINIDIIEKGIEIRCNKSYVPIDNRNIAYKAAEEFIERYNIRKGVFIDIKKNIPVSAGLAGGSTNAAAVLNLMNRLFEINAPLKDLKEIALKLGADVPYCLTGGTALCEGIGEKITNLPSFKNHILVLVKPPFGVSTRDVYTSLKVDKIYKHPNINAIIDSMKKDDLKSVCWNMKNVLENVTLKKHRIIGEIKTSMIEMDAIGSLMSGSGPTVFGLFEDMLKAQRCYDYMKKKYPETYITRTI